MIRRLHAIILLTLLVPAIAGAQELPFTHYTPASETTPLPSAEVSAVYQDREGLIWFVIFSSGLVRYDGHSSELYSTNDGLPDLNVWDVIEDAAGRLWVGSNTGLVVSEKPLGDYAPGERVHFADTFHGRALTRQEIDPNRLARDPDGRVWVGTPGSGIIRLDPDGGVDTLNTMSAPAKSTRCDPPLPQRWIDVGRAGCDRFSPLLRVRPRRYELPATMCARTPAPCTKLPMESCSADAATARSGGRTCATGAGAWYP
jgi:ligand-binding sensor domain-containing protein